MAEESASENDKQEKTSAQKKPKPKPKKVVEKSNTSAQNAIKRKLDAPQESSSKAAHISFVNKIRSMMYGCGDASSPLLESAQLIESIVKQQLNSALVQAANIAEARGSKQIMPEDVLFLFRRDKMKLRRLVKYLDVKDHRITHLKALEDDSEESALPLKKNKAYHEFLNYLDPSLSTYVEEDVFDEVKYLRNMRAGQRSQSLSTDQYIEWAEARAASFCPKMKMGKFRDWLLKDNLTEVKPHPSALDIFHYIAFETVAQLVDLSLLVIQDGNRNQRGINPDLFGLHSNKITSSQNSPPSSPTSSPSPKKKKKNDPVPGLVVRKITPTDIREAINRYWRQTGPFHLFARCPHTTMSTCLLAA